MKTAILLFIGILSLAFIVFLIAYLILEFLTRNKVNDLYVEEKTIKDLIKRFYKKFDMVSNQRTNEILECLKEMEELDSIYYVIIDNGYKFISEESFIKSKTDILNKIISDKIKSIQNGKQKKEKYKSFIDELEVCKKRYQLYEKIFNSNISSIRSKIS